MAHILTKNISWSIILNTKCRVFLVIFWLILTDNYYVFTYEWNLNYIEKNTLLKCNTAEWFHLLDITHVYK